MKDHEENDFKSLVKKTMHVTKLQDKALRTMAALKDVPEYSIVIEALDKHIPEKYLKMAEEELSEQEKAQEKGKKKG